jgi:hypothetical protein
MTDDELFAIYSATRQLAESMEARNVELKKSTAAFEATLVQVRQLPAMLGQQTSKYIAAGIREVVQEDFRQPIENGHQGADAVAGHGGAPCQGDARSDQG